MKENEIKQLEKLVGAVLRTGVFASASILAVGLAATLAFPSFKHGPDIIRAGLLVLIATPVSRVVASVIQYTRDRDWLFSALTLFVLLIVLGSLVFGIKG
jgi:uncharacterized membrane protein